jgi:integrase
MANSTTKPRKRHQQNNFPLTLRADGRYCKKVLGEVYYFGRDREAALNQWLDEKDDLLAGRKPRPKQSDAGITIRDLVIAYLREKKASLTTGELSARSFADAHRTCQNLVDHFGKTRLADDITPTDFAGYRAALAERLSFITLGILIQRTRSIFKFAFENKLIKTLPDYGTGFKKPSKKTLRIQRSQKPPKLLSRDDITKLLDVASVQMKAMILLACNGGLGNSDVAGMEKKHIDFASGWINYPRLKTGVPRRFPLWPETSAALKAALAIRPAHKSPDDANVVFITRCGGRWIKNVMESRKNEGDQDDGSKKALRVNFDDEVVKEFRKLFTVAKVERPKGHGFYTMRHVFETEAGNSCDQVAVDAIMGHCPDDMDMSARYREKLPNDERLQKVTDHMHAWLFPAPAIAETPAIAGRVG